MTNNGTTNIDYIAIIRVDDNNKTVFERIPIEQNHLIESLEKELVDKNATVLMMQRIMEDEFHPTIRKFFNFCAPHEYSDRYIPKCTYPKAINPEEYSKMVDTEIAKAPTRLWDKNSNRYLSEAETIRRVVEAFNINTKIDYLRSAKRYIYATNYERTMNEKVSPLSGIKMYSTDTIGWTHFDYQVTDEVAIHLATNFCYGTSAYFRLCLCYKGINILPYSFLVTYYYASQYELARYTRSYRAERDSWERAFLFVEETANLASKSPEEFVERWIRNEVEMMMKGLRIILRKPSEFIVKCQKSAGDSISERAHLVRNMELTESTHYAILKDEMELTIKAEKISGAVNFLDNLLKLSDEILEIKDTIKEIRTLAQSILPEIRSMLMKIEEHINQLEVEKKKKEDSLTAVQRQLAPHEKVIKRREDKAMKENGVCYPGLIRQEYSDEHPIYGELVEKENTLQKDINQLIGEINLRQSFYDEIASCKKTITDAGIDEND